MSRAKKLDLGPWVKEAANRNGQTCRICASKAAREWFLLACAEMERLGLRVSLARIVDRLEKDTGLRAGITATRNHARLHTEGAWQAVLDAAASRG